MEKMLVKTNPVLNLDDEVLFDFCQLNDTLKIERNSKGQLILMPLNGYLTAVRKSEINYQLANWNKKTKLGRVCDSSTGFLLANGAMRSPDVSWISKESEDSISKQDKERFIKLCPDFVIELRSSSDSVKELDIKMKEDWIGCGCKLAWLIDPFSEIVFIYRADGTIAKVNDFEGSLSGEDVLPGFAFELSELRID